MARLVASGGGRVDLMVILKSRGEKEKGDTGRDLEPCDGLGKFESLNHIQILNTIKRVCARD